MILQGFRVYVHKGYVQIVKLLLPLIHERHVIYARFPVIDDVEIQQDRTFGNALRQNEASVSGLSFEIRDTVPYDQILR